MSWHLTVYNLLQTYIYLFSTDKKRRFWNLLKPAELKILFFILPYLFLQYLQLSNIILDFILGESFVEYAVFST